MVSIFFFFLSFFYLCKYVARCVVFLVIISDPCVVLNLFCKLATNCVLIYVVFKKRFGKTDNY